MRFLRGLVVTFSIFMLSLFFVSGLVSFSTLFYFKAYDFYTRNFILKTCLASFSLTFPTVLICKNIIMKELRESKKFYTINMIIYSIIIFAGTIMIIVGEASGWNRLDVWVLGMLLLIAAVGELVLSFIIHSLYVHVKQA